VRGKDHESSSRVMYAQKLRYSSLMPMQERKSGNTTSQRHAKMDGWTASAKGIWTA
jgi:hypothetical protein